MKEKLYKDPGDFKVLLVYANTPMEPLVPLGIASLATQLQLSGFSVKLFDTTFYKRDDDSNDQDARVKSLQIKAANYSKVGVEMLDKDPIEDFIILIHDYKPDLVGVSCVEVTYELGLKLLKSIRELKIPNIIGGCFATFSTEEIMSNDLVDMICTGEGENLIAELARRMVRNEPISDIPNLWSRKEGKVVKSEKVDLVDVKSLPVPNFNIFAPERIYRAMSGKIYRMLPVEFSRGCPYQCSYCSAPSYAKKFVNSGKWLRFKNINQIMKEIDFYVNEYDVEYFYFISETFLAMPAKKRQEFYKHYEKYRIPFWFNTRPETINDKDVKCLERIGCHRISIGIESGNEEFRRKMLKRNYSNKAVLKAVDIIQKTNIQLSVNNMIGFPDETRDMVFDTIELNRKFEADDHSVSIFQPFRGTELYNYCMLKGYLDPDKKCSESFTESVLEMPSLSKDQIKGLHRTFNLYRRMDRSFWPDIEKAESLDEDGDKIFFNLVKNLK